MTDQNLPAEILARQVQMIEDYQTLPPMQAQPAQPAPQQPMQQAPAQPAPQQPMQQVPAQPVPQPMQQVPAPQPPMQDADASIIAQLQAQNAALIEQNNNLNAQVVRMVQNGAQFSQQPMQPLPNQIQMPSQTQQYAYPPVYGGNDYMPASLSQDVDVSLESLAGEIGKKPE